MLRKAKPRSTAQSKPEIWVDGQQIAPFNLGAWSRSSGILARRAAASTLSRVSIGCAALAFGLEGGRWSVNLSVLGPAARILPSRRSMARGLARLSRVQAMAAELVDHQSKPVTPLEIDDLSAFLANRRLASLEAAAEKQHLNGTGAARSELPVQPGWWPDDDLKNTGLAASGDAKASPATLHSGSTEPETGAVPVLPLVSLEELNAIRMALASAPEPRSAPPLFGEDTPSDLKDDASAQPIKSAPRANWYFEPVIPAEPPALVPITSAVGGVLYAVLRWIGARIVRLLSVLWRPTRTAIARTSAFALGWICVILALPYALVRALILHFNFVDLRYFD